MAPMPAGVSSQGPLGKQSQRAECQARRQACQGDMGSQPKCYTPNDIVRYTTESLLDIAT
jgi:hypothetical protein